jgi:hypothetical protein
MKVKQTQFLDDGRACCQNTYHKLATQKAEAEIKPGTCFVCADCKSVFHLNTLGVFRFKELQVATVAVKKTLIVETIATNAVKFKDAKSRELLIGIATLADMTAEIAKELEKAQAELKANPQFPENVNCKFRQAVETILNKPFKP